MTVNSSRDLLQACYWVDRQPLRLEVPLELLRMRGGLKIERHPFVQALSIGPGALQEFYGTFQPRNLAQLYRLAEKGREGEELDPTAMPWIDRLRPKKPSGEKGLPASHGESFYGPVSPEKLDLEYRRLVTINKSIKAQGFRQGLSYSKIEGVVFRSGDNCVFEIRGGKHRAAVLVHQGWKRIPVAFTPHWPRLIDADHVWALKAVERKQIDPDFLREIVAVTCKGAEWKN